MNIFKKTVKKLIKEPHHTTGELLYYSGQEVLSEDFNYLYTHGGRGAGKSTWWKRFIFKYCWDSMKDNPQKANKQFILLRRWDLETKKNLADNYWRDFDVKEMTDGVYDDIEVFGGCIYLCKYKKDFSLKRGPVIGFVHGLSRSSKYKSGEFGDVDWILYEEAIPQLDDNFLENEPDMLQQYVSTIARHRHVRVIMLGNDKTRADDKYIEEWGLYRSQKQKEDTFDIYEYDTGFFDETTSENVVVKIICEKTAELPVKSKMAFGEVSKSISGSSYQTKNMPKLPDDYSSYTAIWTIFVESGLMTYWMEFLMSDDGEYIWYVRPTKKFISEKHKREKVKDMRIVSDKFYQYAGYTDKFIPLTEEEVNPLAMIRMGRVCFSDNLTGTEFEEILEKF